MTRRIAFQGELGAYSEAAIHQLFRAPVDPVPRPDFSSVALAVLRREAEAGVLPIENTLAGSVVGSYDALSDADPLRVVGETILPIHHCLLALPGSTLEGLEEVASHPVALAQCGAFLRAHPHLRIAPSYDTAGAAREVAARRDTTRGAIAGRPAAERYGLAVLADHIEDRQDNQTRFLALARGERVLADAATPSRTALLVVTANIPGALLRVLSPFADAGLNLSKLESRPTGEPWSYRFFLELEHLAGDEAVWRALEHVRAVSQEVRRLGTYARWPCPPLELPGDVRAIPRG